MTKLRTNLQERIDVSIVIPVRNGERYIVSAVESVITGITGNLKYEIIVSENYSTDNTPIELQKLEHPSLRIYTPTMPLNAAENWNYVCSLARGRFIKLLCADDLLIASSLESEVKELEQNVIALASFSPRKLIGPKGKFVLEMKGLKKYLGVQDFDFLLKKSFLSGTNIFGEPGCVLFRRETLISTLPWSLELPYVIDLDFYIRALRGRSVIVLEKPSSKFRIHQGSVTSLLSKSQSRDFIQLFKKFNYVFESQKYLRIISFYILCRARLNQILRNIVYKLASKHR